MIAVVFIAAFLAQNQGSPPIPLLDGADIFTAYNLTLPDGTGRPPDDQASTTQVGMRAQKLGITSQSAVAAWKAAQSLSPRVASAMSAVSFSGTTASALNILLRNSPSVQVNSSSITIDQPIVLTDGDTLDLGNSQLTSAISDPYMVRIESAHGVNVLGGSFTQGNSAILVNKSTDVLIDRSQITGLTGDGVVITASSRVTVSHLRISGLSGPGLVLNSGASQNVIVSNDISNGLGQSNWDAGVLVTDRDVDLASNPQSIFDGGGYWPVFSPIKNRLNPPHNNLIASNRIATNHTSGIYMDGSTQNVVYANTITGNAKEGLCLDNGATANVVTSNTIQQNGNRWGQSDQTLTLDFVQGRLPDGTAAAKLPGISIDNGIYNIVYGNNISHNSGGGIKMVRTGFFNTLAMNKLESDNDGASIYYRFFAITLGAAAGDAPSAELDFTPSRGNIIVSDIIRGSNGTGIYIEGGSDENQMVNNVIMDAVNFAIESQVQLPQNDARDNLTNLPSFNVPACCSFTGRGPRTR